MLKCFAFWIPWTLWQVIGSAKAKQVTWNIGPWCARTDLVRNAFYAQGRKKNFLNYVLCLFFENKGALTLECRYCKRHYTYAGYLQRHELECAKTNLLWNIFQHKWFPSKYLDITLKTAFAQVLVYFLNHIPSISGYSDWPAQIKHIFTSEAF
jgi:hypothetical protein